MSGPVKRSYESPLRKAHAESTRLVIIRAATRLFVEHGYGSTSMDAIAEAAGVSRATVFSSVGGKATLLRAAYDVAIVGDDEPVPVPQRPWARHVVEARDNHTLLDRYGEMLAMVDERVAALYEVLRGAASADAEVREDWAEIAAGRRQGAANVIGFVHERGSLREGLDDEAAADIVLVFMDPGLFHLLVRERGWEIEAFSTWLGRSLREQLLPTRRARRP